MQIVTFKITLFWLRPVHQSTNVRYLDQYLIIGNVEMLAECGAVMSVDDGHVDTMMHVGGDLGLRQLYWPKEFTILM